MLSSRASMCSWNVTFDCSSNSFGMWDRYATSIFFMANSSVLRTAERVGLPVCVIFNHCTATEMLVLLLVVASMLTLLLTRQKRGVSPNVTDTLTNRLHVSAFFVQNHAY